MPRTNNTHLKLVLVAGLALAAALLAACSGTPAAETKAATPEASKPATASGPMTLKILEPANGAEVPAGTLKVTVETTGIEFVMPSNDLVDGQGHVHFTLDDGPEVMSVEKVAELEVAPGKHVLKAHLVQNNTEPVDPPVEQVIEFTAK